MREYTDFEKKVYGYDKMNETQQTIVEMLNEEQGEPRGYDCPVCNNKQKYYAWDGNGVSCKKCSCIEIRKNLELAKNSGLGKMLETKTFATYEPTTEQQQKTLAAAKKFITDENGVCFYIGGNVGTGKTHLCAAMCKEFIAGKTPVRYMVWQDWVTRLKQAIANDAEAYEVMLEEAQTAEVLFIDDLFRVKVTDADREKAHLLINYRYNLWQTEEKRYATLITSEKTLQELAEVDEAIASRIYEMAGEYKFTASGRNYRLR